MQPAATSPEPSEIGGYFELEQLVRHEYYDHLIRLNSARNALLYVLRARGVRTLYLPYFMCDCMEKTVREAGVAVVLYEIGRDFLPARPVALAAGEYLLLGNHYGLLTEAQIRLVQRACGRLILDNTHAFFNAPLDGMDTLCSCRKFFGVPDGAYLATDTALSEPLAPSRSAERMGHLLGRAEHPAHAYFQLFRENDASLDSAPLASMSALTQNLLGAVDYPRVMERRRANYGCYDALLGAANPLRFPSPNVPFVYPYYMENGLAVKKALAARGIYVATYWPNVLALPQDTVEYDYAANILPLPCDQRYGPADCERVVSTLEKLTL